VTVESFWLQVDERVKDMQHSPMTNRCQHVWPDGELPTDDEFTVSKNRLKPAKSRPTGNIPPLRRAS
jgi:hypothetical protein